MTLVDPWRSDAGHGDDLVLGLCPFLAFGTVAFLQDL
jgi:hypothetical protein